MHLIEQCPALSPSKRRPKVPQVIQEPSSANLQPSTAGLQVPHLSSESNQVIQEPSSANIQPSVLQDPHLSSENPQVLQPQPMTQPPTLTKPSQALEELPKESPTQLSAQAEIGAIQKASECAIVPKSECDKSSTLHETTGCGAASAVPALLEDVSLTSEIELPNEGRPELRKKSQRVRKDKKCEQVDKSPPKDEEK